MLADLERSTEASPRAKQAWLDAYAALPGVLCELHPDVAAEEAREWLSGDRRSRGARNNAIGHARLSLWLRANAWRSATDLRDKLRVLVASALAAAAAASVAARHTSTAVLACSDRERAADGLLAAPPPLVASLVAAPNSPNG
jgi:hypothetical protein